MVFEEGLDKSGLPETLKEDFEKLDQLEGQYRLTSVSGDDPWGRTVKAWTSVVLSPWTVTLTYSPLIDLISFVFAPKMLA